MWRTSDEEVMLPRLLRLRRLCIEAATAILRADAGSAANPKPQRSAKSHNTTNLLQRAGFDAETVEVIADAYIRTRRSADDADSADLINEIIAFRILSLAKQGERDPDRLRAGALAPLWPQPIRSADKCQSTSAIGTKRTCGSGQSMAAFGVTADNRRMSEDVC